MAYVIGVISSSLSSLCLGPRSNSMYSQPASTIQSRTCVSCAPNQGNVNEKEEEISSRLGPTDAEIMEREFCPEFSARDLVNLVNYHMYLKLMVDGVVSKPLSAVTALAP